MHVFWVGVLAGMAVIALGPGWLKLATLVVAVVLSGLLMRLRTLPHHHLQFHATVPPLLIAVAGVVFGLWAWHYARKRGLQQLGEHELRNRWGAMRGVSKWGW
jgi:hypothetical protein